MKNKLIILLSLLFLITNCKKSLDIQEVQTYQFKWHLINTTGGFAGVNDEFEKNTIIWVFNDLNGTLSVENNNMDNTKNSSLPTKKYNYYTITKNEDTEDEKTFLIIDENEFGQIDFGEEYLIINKNSLSTNTLTDQFIYKFEGEMIEVSD